MDFFIYKHYAICDDRKRETESEKLRRVVRKKATTIFSALYFSFVSLSLSLCRNSMIKIEKSLLKIVRCRSRRRRRRCRYICSLAHSLLTQPNTFFFFFHNRPVSFSLFCQFPRCLRQFMLMFSSYVCTYLCISFDERRDQKNWSECVKTALTERTKCVCEKKKPDWNCTYRSRIQRHTSEVPRAASLPVANDDFQYTCLQLIDIFGFDLNWNCFV